jgi:hypothetical protein
MSPDLDFGPNNNSYQSSGPINKYQYEPKYLRERGEINPKESMISMISETYEFVDFTNTKTLYKDKVPRNKAKNSNSPGPAAQPIVHLNTEELLNNLPKYPPDRYSSIDSSTKESDMRKKVSPIY